MPTHGQYRNPVGELVLWSFSTLMRPVLALVRSLRRAYRRTYRHAVELAGDLVYAAPDERAQAALRLIAATVMTLSLLALLAVLVIA